MAASSPSPCTPIQIYRHRRKSIFSPSSICSLTFKKSRLIRKFGGIQSAKASPFEGNNGFEEKINVMGETESAEIDASNAVKDELFVRFFREAWPYFLAHRGSTFVVLISAEIVDSPHLDPILMARLIFTFYDCFSAELSAFGVCSRPFAARCNKNVELGVLSVICLLAAASVFTD